MASRIGIASFAHLHAHSYAASCNELAEVELVGIWDDDPARGKQAAGSYETEFLADLDALLGADLDGVIVTSENARHREHVLAAAAAGVDVLCEKPISVSVPDAQEMIDGCAGAKVQLMISFPCRYSPALQRALAATRAGELGEILCIKGTNRGRNPGGWFNDVELAGGGSVMDHTVHIVDLMRLLLEDEVAKVYAEIDTRFDPDLDCDDTGILTMTFEGGCVATLDASWSRPPHYPIWGDATMCIIGTGGNCWLDLFVEHLDLYRNPDSSYVWESYGYGADTGVVGDFARCAQSGEPVPITGYDGLKAMEVALGAYQSAETGQPVELPLA
jgi:UDP-N-acetylglucosamine 3-dehydrogenase